MIGCDYFIELLKRHHVDFFVGVPDSLLKELCKAIMALVPPQKHILAVNEGAAIGIAAGYHLGAHGYAAVYMQNSGQGNALNPLTSLADPEIYSIPLFMIIGWRGRPGSKDEPQHVKQGRITCGLLDVLEIPYRILTPDTNDFENDILELLSLMKHQSRPVALIIAKGTFAGLPSHVPTTNSYSLKREYCLEQLIKAISPRDVVISTTGHISREIYELREKNGMSRDHDFLVVGSMGHASQIALGIAVSRPDRTVYCLDGDGALLMHMGGLATIGSIKPVNFKHIALNNGAHGSVGDQPTVGFSVSFRDIAKACGYGSQYLADNEEALQRGIRAVIEDSGPAFLEIRTALGARSNLGRPKSHPIENKHVFMRSV